jgi:hypothetical protein
LSLGSQVCWKLKPEATLREAGKIIHLHTN